jgi:hypothetical protein
MVTNTIALQGQPIAAPDILGMAGQAAKTRYIADQTQGSEQVSNALASGIKATDPSLLQFGKRGQEVYSAGIEGEAKKLKIASDTTLMYRSLLDNINDPETARQWVAATYADPVLGPVLNKFNNVEKATATIPTDPAGFQRWKQQASLGAADFAKKFMVSADAALQAQTSRRTQNIQQQRIDLDTKRFNQGEFTPPIEMDGPNGVGYYVINKNDPSDVRQVGANAVTSSIIIGQTPPVDPAIANALSASSGAAGGAPSNVNALTTPLGAPSQAPSNVNALTTPPVPAPVAPATQPTPSAANAPFKKPDTAAVREKQIKAEKGQENIAKVLDKMFDSYDQLNKAKAIPSSKNTALQNLQAYGAASMPQIGRAVGSKEQGIRDTIEQIRPSLIQAIKNATGMSAQEMNSNVELQIQLKAATDPALQIESNIAALNNISSLYGLGKEYAIPGVGGTPEVPPGAVEYLRANPELASDFEEEFNLPAGSAQQYLGGGNGR